MTPRTRSLLLVGLLAAGAVLAFRAWSGGGDRLDAASFADRPADALVVDVRTPDEYASGHVAGALHADLFGDFETQMASVDRSLPVYLYCASGARSGRAASILEDMGFQSVVNAGGFRDLAAAGAPTETGPAR